MDDKNKKIKQYQTIYKELQIECNNLKKLLDTVDPLDIDFKQKYYTIDNLKFKLNKLHLDIIDDIE